MFLKVGRRAPREALKSSWGAACSKGALGGRYGVLESETKIQPHVKTTIPYSKILTKNRCQQILQGPKPFTVVITIALAEP